MTEFLELNEAVKKYVTPGCSLAAEGFTHLIPHAAGAEIIRHEIRHLTLIRMTPDVIFDQLIGMGCADKLVFSWGGNPGVGSLFRLRDAYENGVPHEMDFEEHAHAAMANAYAAGAAGMPCAVFKGYRGTQYPEVNPNIRFIACPFTGEELTVIPSQKEAILAAACSIVTVEEVVDSVDESSGGTVVPRWAVDVVCKAPLGAFPSYAEGYYDRSNLFYQKWGEVSREYEVFFEWMERYVMTSENFTHYLARLKEDGYV
jgi:glutaconate CoA-transferase subunit A